MLSRSHSHPRLRRFLRDFGKDSALSEALITIAGSVRSTATILAVVVATKNPKHLNTQRAMVCCSKL
jgi:hypothetical protein